VAILNFMPTFIATSKKKLWELSDKDEEQEAAVEPSSGFFGSVFEYVDDAFDWQPPVEQDFSVPEPFYDAPAEDMGIGTAIGDAFGDIQWGQPDPGIGSAIGDFGFGDYQLENTIGAPVEPWGWENGATEDWWATNQEYQAPQWDLPTIQPEPTFRTNLADSVAASGMDPWSDVIDMRGGGGSALAPTDSFTGLNVAGDTGGWQLPDFGSIFSDIAGGYGSALTDTPDEYAFDEANWAPVPTGADPEFYRSQTPEDQAYLANELGFGSDFISGIGGLPQETLAKYSFDEMPTRDLGSTLGGGLKDIWNTVDTVYSQLPELAGDSSFDPIRNWANPDSWDETSFGLRKSDPNGEWNSIATPVLMPSAQIDPDLEYPFQDTVANIREADNPWDFANLQADNYHERPQAEQLALQIVNPGNGLWGNVDDLPKVLGTAEKIADWTQGGPLVNAVTGIPGAGAFAKNVLLPGAVGAGGGAATDLILTRPSRCLVLTGSLLSTTHRCLRVLALVLVSALARRTLASRSLAPLTRLETSFCRLDSRAPSPRLRMAARAFSRSFKTISTRRCTSFVTRARNRRPMRSTWRNCVSISLSFLTPRFGPRVLRSRTLSNR